MLKNTTSRHWSVPRLALPSPGPFCGCGGSGRPFPKSSLRLPTPAQDFCSCLWLPAIPRAPPYTGPLLFETVLAAPSPAGPREELGFCLGAHQHRSGNASGGEGEMECSRLPEQPGHRIGLSTSKFLSSHCLASFLLERMLASHKTTEGHS